MIGSDRFHRFYLKECLSPREGDKVLDIGCGPGEFLDFLPDVDNAKLARFGCSSTCIGWVAC